MTNLLVPADLGTVLSMWAHPDDETFLAGGVMAEARDAGQTVVCVSATAGEHGTDDPEGWPPDILGALRRQEAAAAMAILGVTDHRWLDYEDGTLAAGDRTRAVTRIRTLMDEIEPDTILTFAPDGMTFHPDHQTISSWVSEAWEADGCRGRLLWAAATTEHYTTFGPRYEELGIYMTDERPQGVDRDRLEIFLVLEGAAYERKERALRAMPSQTAELFESLDADTLRLALREEAFVAATDITLLS
ncbi:PIG-L family deacetylase [soil metagenome]